MSYIPRGCDQQGRYPEAAEAATEVGIDDLDLENCPARAVLTDIMIALCVLSAMYLIVSWVL